MMDDPRGCTVRELEAVIHLCNQVFRPEGGDMGREYPVLFHPNNTFRVRTLWEGSQVISHAGYVNRDSWILGSAFRTASVGAVCTHPDHRGKGYASMVMADLEQTARDEGCDLMLVSGGRSLYRRMGCTRVGRFPTYRLAPRRNSVSFTVRPAGREDVRALVGLHQAEPVRFERSVDDWALILECQMLMNGRADILLVEHEGRPVAYLGVQRPGRGGIARVLEYGGSRNAIWSALGQAAGNAETVEVVQMPGDQEIELLVGPGVERSERAFAGTVKILNPGTFFEKAEALLFERAGEEVANDMVLSAGEGAVTFEWQGQYLDVTFGDAPVLVFGPPPDGVPIPMPEPPLGSILHDLFPLPLLWSGFNYV